MLEITNLADQAVLLPVALAVGVVLALAGWRRGALAWAVGVGGTYAVLAASKLLLLQCGPMPQPVPFTLRSPSGHTAGAGVVYGALLGLGAVWAAGPARVRPGWAAVAVLPPVLAAVLPVVVLIGWTRVALGVHTVPDVVAGGVLGTLGAASVVVAAGPPSPRLRGWTVGLPVLAAVALAYGWQFPGEALLRSLAALVWSGPACR